MAIPLPPGSSSTPVKVTQEEISIIFDRHLRPEHRDDPNIINFIKQYLNCRSVGQAARTAGISLSSGNALMRRNDIVETIRKITETSVLKYGYDATEVVERVKEVMNVDPGDLENEDGTFVESLKGLDPAVRRGIKKFTAKNIYEYDPNGVKVYAGKLITVEFWDKMKAVELLGREKDMFKETKVHHHDLGKNMSSVLLDSKKRAEDAVIEMREVGDVGEAKTFSAQITHSGSSGDAGDREPGTGNS